MRRHMNWPMLCAALAIVTLGCLALHSVRPDWWRHAAYALIGMGMFLTLRGVHFWKLRKTVWWVYGAALLTLVMVMLPGVGQSANGAQRWLSLGPLGTFQPSELAKLALILVLAKVLSDKPTVSSRRFLFCLAVQAPLFLLTVEQPDLGTALVLASITLGMLFLGGGNLVYLSGLIVGGCGILPFILKEYQRNRILVFLNPDLDPRGMGYNLLQSRTAIGSGGFWGQGLANGSMSQNGFVPENSTDFVITVIGEELGWLGCIGMLLLYFILFSLLVRICAQSTSRFGALLAGGTACMLAFQAVVNIGMTMGVLPAVGIPLPMVSNGGSSLLVTFICLGIAASVDRNTPKLKKEVQRVEISRYGWAA